MGKLIALAALLICLAFLLGWLEGVAVWYTMIILVVGAALWWMVATVNAWLEERRGE